MNFRNSEPVYRKQYTPYTNDRLAVIGHCGSSRSNGLSMKKKALQNLGIYRFIDRLTEVDPWKLGLSSCVVVINFVALL